MFLILCSVAAELTCAFFKRSFWRRIPSKFNLEGQTPGPQPGNHSPHTHWQTSPNIWLSAWKMFELPVQGELASLFRSRCLHFMDTVHPRIYKSIGQGVPNNAIIVEFMQIKPCN